MVWAAQNGASSEPVVRLAFASCRRLRSLLPETVNRVESHVSHRKQKIGTLLPETDHGAVLPPFRSPETRNFPPHPQIHVPHPMRFPAKPEPLVSSACPLT
jgi:hypothetical protein